jgi:26S proteasome regulatory subunit N2
MGLVMMGTNDHAAIEEMCQYAIDTQHEKIIRGLAVGIAMVVYNRLEEADSLIDNLMKNKVIILFI